MLTFENKSRARRVRPLDKVLKPGGRARPLAWAERTIPVLVKPADKAMSIKLVALWTFAEQSLFIQIGGADGSRHST